MSSTPIDSGESPEDCVVDNEDQDDVADDWSPHDELHEQFRPGPIKKIEAGDGMPAQHSDATQSDIPKLSMETLVCMGDFSAFVLLDLNGEEADRFGPDKVERTPNGTWLLKVAEKKLNMARTRVEPLRPPCKHYARQLTQLPSNPEHKKMLRLCTARRDTAGAFMAVDDLAMWGCDLREPRHIESEDKMTAFDDKKIEQGKNRELIPIFEGFGTIFDKSKKSEPQQE